MRTPRNEALGSDKQADDAGSERTCVLTRRKDSKEALIRLALGPDGAVAPDVRARAPGRGAWISVGRELLDEANAKGKLKPALQRAFKTNELHVPSNLGERTEHALRKTALDRLGMEARAGNLINGADKVEAAARAGRVHLLLHALETPLHVVAVGHEELEPQGLEVVVRTGVTREPVQHGEDGVDLAQVAEELWPGAGHVDHADRGGCDLPRRHEARELLEPVVGDRRHADVRLVRHGRIRRDLRAGAGQRVEQRRLAAVRKPYDPDLERHRRPG